MKYLIRQFDRLAREEDAASVIEYALLVSLIAMAVFVAVVAIGNQLDTTFQGVYDILP